MHAYILHDGQPWDPFECDVPWETVALPRGETFTMAGSCARRHASGSVRCTPDMNGRWTSGARRVDFALAPRKRHVFFSESNPIDNLSVVQAGMKRSKYLFEVDRIGSRRKTLGAVVRHFRELGYVRYSYVDRHGGRYRDMPSFIGQSYVLPDRVRARPVKKAVELLWAQHPSVHASPYMSPLQQRNHACGRFLEYLLDLRTRRPELSDQCRELKSRAESLAERGVARGEQLLDSVCALAERLGVLTQEMNRSIYNYGLVTKFVGARAESGLYVYSSCGFVPFTVLSVAYASSTAVRGSTVLPVGGAADGAFLVRPGGSPIYYKVPPGARGLSVDTGLPAVPAERAAPARTSEPELWFLVERQVFLRDRTEVNTKTRTYSVGSARCRAVRMYYLYR